MMQFLCPFFMELLLVYSVLVSGYTEDVSSVTLYSPPPPPQPLCNLCTKLSIDTMFSPVDVLILKTQSRRFSASLGNYSTIEDAARREESKLEVFLQYCYQTTSKY